MKKVTQWASLRARNGRNIRRSVGCFLTLLVSAIALGADSKSFTRTAGFQHHPEIHIELLVSEPNVVDPVALTFDEWNQMYVVEMRDYPYGATGIKGTVRLLKFDENWALREATVFAQDLNFPTSITAWKGGVFVTAPPQILYLKDTNGDGEADVREVVFDGFRSGVTDSNVNGLRWGLDNRIHGANGGNDGRVFRVGSSGDKIDVGDADFSFDPRSFSFQRTVHSASGFGLVFNEVGDSFSTYNIEHIQQRIVPFRYLELLPRGVTFWGTVDISDHGPAGRIFPVSDSETRVNHPEQAGHFSAAGGMGYLSRALFGDALGDCVLVCDVVGNLVHRDVLVRSDAIWKATRAPEEQETDFIASYDLAFRPVGLETGPDGALYLIDMQRRVIEHPDYIPEAVKGQMNLREGETRGRIYRVTPVKGSPRKLPKLAGLSNQELVLMLDHKNSWVRHTSQRLLIEREASEVSKELRSLLAAGSTFGRLHAMWSLHGMRALEKADLTRLLRDGDPGVRRNALLVMEARQERQARLVEEVLALVEDVDASVQLQAVLTLGVLGHVDKSKKVKALTRLIKSERWASKWLSVAVLCSLGDELGNVVSTLLKDEVWVSSLQTWRAEMLGQLLKVTIIGGEDECKTLVGLVVKYLDGDKISDDVMAALLAGTNAGLEELGVNMEASESFAEGLAKGRGSRNSRLRIEACRFGLRTGSLNSDELAEQLAWANSVILDDALPLERRVEVVEMFRLGSYEAISTVLWKAFFTCHSVEIQRAFCSVLRSYQDEEVAVHLLAHWREILPGARSDVTNVLLRRRLYHEPLVAALENQTISLGELNLDLEQRRRLRRSSHPEVMKRARLLFGDEEYSHRSDQVEQVIRLLPAQGDRARGKNIFKTHCAACHQFAGEGHAVGPPLTSLSHRSVEDLASNILDPGMAINPRYSTVDLELVDGEAVSGILLRQDQNSVTIGFAQGLEERIERSRIQTVQYSKHSLMPSGWETVISPQQLRDVIALLRDEEAADPVGQ